MSLLICTDASIYVNTLMLLLTLSSWEKWCKLKISLNSSKKMKFWEHILSKPDGWGVNVMDEGKCIDIVHSLIHYLSGHVFEYK